MHTFSSYSLKETKKIAKQLLNLIAVAHLDSKTGVLIGLSGHLGAGKTAFVKAVARELGVNGEITSPTFVLMKSYETSHPKWKKLVHIDLYRIEDKKELGILHLEELKKDPCALVMIEWPENAGLESKNLDGLLTVRLEDKARIFAYTKKED